MRANHSLDKRSDSAATNDRIQTVIDLLIEGDRKFLLHLSSLIRMADV